MSSSQFKETLCHVFTCSTGDVTIFCLRQDVLSQIAGSNEDGLLLQVFLPSETNAHGPPPPHETVGLLDRGGGSILSLLGGCELPGDHSIERYEGRRSLPALSFLQSVPC